MRLRLLGGLLAALALAASLLSQQQLAAMQALVARSSSSMWQSYCHHLNKRPLLTKAATGVVGTIIGDGVAQYTASRGRQRGGGGPIGYDAGRAARLCLYATAIGTPIGHYWFSFLDRCIFPAAMSHPLTALSKTALDQLVMAPAGIALFFTAMGLLEGQGVQQSLDGMRAKLRPTLLANYALWPAANMVNFAFVPPQQRILYCNVVYVFWASFLSTMASKKADGPGQLDLAQKEL